MLQHIPFIMRNTLRNKRRSLLTLASIAVSLCLLGLLLALYVALFAPGKGSDSQARRLVVHHKVSITQVMPASYRQKIEQVPGVVAVSGWQWYGGVYKDASKSENFFARFAVDPNTLFIIRADLVISPEAVRAFQTERTACVMGQELADRLGVHVGDTIPLTGDIFPGSLQLKLVGTFRAPEKADEDVLFLNWLYVSEGLPAAYRDIMGSYLVLVDKPDDVARVGKTIDTMFANSPAPTKSESESDFALSFVKFLGNLKLFLAVIAGAVIFTIVLVCGNTIAMAVRERTRETAILRTLGFAPLQIAGFILGEAALLGLLGGLIGALLASAVCGVLARVPLNGLRPPQMTGPVDAVVVGLAVVIGVVSAAIPAFFAARRSVLDSLRYSG